MLRVERRSGKLVRLAEATLGTAGLEEGSGVQELILHNPAVFFEQECRETLFIISKEVEPSTEVGDRIDLLALDSEGRSVIIELKRGSHKLQLLQALSYAAMISDWEPEQFEGKIADSRREQYRNFEGRHGFETINEFQRVILIAESFDFEVLKTAQWLTDSYGLNITCYKLSLAQEVDSGAEYLSVVQLFPPRELATQARRRGAQKSERGNRFADIEELLQSCTNPEIVAFFESSLELRRNRRRDSLVFPKLGKMRFRVRPKGDYARVGQLGRFEGDQALWESRMSDPQVRVRATDVRFRLKTKADIAAFLAFTTSQLSTTNWQKNLGADATESSEEDED